MIDERWIILGVTLNFLGAIGYLVDTVKGKTKPNRVTWFMWALAPLVAFFAEIKQGVGLQSLMTFMVGFSPLLIFIASFVNRKSEWKITKLDIICGSLSLLGLILWAVTRHGNIAILFAIIADGLAALPTIVKSYRAPETENYWVFLAAMVSAGITLLTITMWNFEHYAFPVYILAVCTILFVLIKFKVGNLVRAAQPSRS